MSNNETLNQILKTSAVGVTFSNKEDGESRQDILKSLYHQQVIDVVLKQTSFHNPDTNEDEPAIELMECLTGKRIGFIAKQEIPLFWNNCGHMTGMIGLYKGCYFCELRTPIAPTRKQYQYVMSLINCCQAEHLCVPNDLYKPFYDRAAYSRFIDRFRNEVL